MKFNKPCVNFWRVWTKNTKCWEILRKFLKILKKLLERFVKMLYFSISFKRLNKPVFLFRRLDKKHKLLGNFEKMLKIFDENSIEKLNFIMLFGKFATKNRAFGNNIFLQQFFPFRGGRSCVPSPPGGAYEPCVNFLRVCTKKTICRKFFRKFS